MQRARALFYVCGGLLLLALGWQVGSSEASAQGIVEKWSSPSRGRLIATGHCTASGVSFLYGGPDGRSGQTGYSSLAIIDGTSGATRWTYSPVVGSIVGYEPADSRGQSGPQLVDVDGDGRDEVLFIDGDQSLLHCFGFDEATQTIHPGPPQDSIASRAVPFGVGPSVPNPASRLVHFAVSLPAPGPIAVIVVDVAGRVVRTLHHNADRAGDVTMSWDGHDESGRIVAAGAYYYRVRTNVGESTRTMVWLR